MSTHVKRDVYAVAIIGGGFAGMMVAAELVRRSSVPLQLHVYEPIRTVGLGAAYSTTDVCHLLNVPAQQMGAWADDPGDFYNWLCAENACWRHMHPFYETLEVTNKAFLPRALYGHYLQNLWHNILLEAKSKRIAVHVHQAEVIDLQKTTDGVAVIDMYRTQIESCCVDAVVLSMGVSPMSLRAKLTSSAANSGLYLADPWRDADQFSQFIDSVVEQPDGNVVLLGSGLTTVDIAMSLLQKGFSGKLSVLSRSGMLPQPHAVYNPFTQLAFNVAEQPLKAHKLLHQWRCMRANCNDWRAAIDALRKQTVMLWRGLPLQEQRIMLRHLGSLWNRHRHRAPQQTWRRLQDALADGQLELIAGSVETIEQADVAHLRVRYSVHSAVAEARSLTATAIVNALGWEADVRRRISPLLQHLLARGWITSHGLHRGLQAKEGCCLAGIAPCPLYGVGALLSGEYFESTAVPEVRQQCAAIAQSLLNHSFEKNKC